MQASESHPHLLTDRSPNLESQGIRWHSTENNRYRLLPNSHFLTIHYHFSTPFDVTQQLWFNRRR
jgi:hypothetical protein